MPQNNRVAGPTVMISRYDRSSNGRRIRTHRSRTPDTTVRLRLSVGVGVGVLLPGRQPTRTLRCVPNERVQCGNRVSVVHVGIVRIADDGCAIRADSDSFCGREDRPRPGGPAPEENVVASVAGHDAADDRVTIIADADRVRAFRQDL